MQKIYIPSRFEEIYKKDDFLRARIDAIKIEVEKFIFTEPQRKFYFSEYTDHGIDHIQNVLGHAADLIPDSTLKFLEPYEVSYLISAILIHDIAMHITPDTFLSLIKGNYDELKIENKVLDHEKGWKEEYNHFIFSLKKFNKKQKLELWGEKNHSIKYPNLKKLEENGESQNKIITEFLRKHHARYCHEISIKGFITSDGRINSLYGTSDIRYEEKQLIGLLARSHNYDINGLDTYLVEKFASNDRPLGVHIKYLMAVLRIADYMEIDSERCGLNDYRPKKSRRSLIENEKQGALWKLKNIPAGSSILDAFVANPDSYSKKDAHIIPELRQMLRDFQIQLNLSWKEIALLNQGYKESRFALAYDEIRSNLLSYDYPGEKNQKIMPYRYKGFEIENYLKSAFQHIKDIRHIYDSKTLGKAPDSDLRNLYCPLSFKRISSAYISYSDTSSAPDSNIESVDIHPQHLLRNVKYSLGEILTEKSRGIGIVSEPGFGKTILSKALFLFFAGRCFNDSDTNEFIGDEVLINNKTFGPIPLFFSCYNYGKIEPISTINDFIVEILRQVRLERGSIGFEPTLKTIRSIFMHEKQELLIIIDAIDEIPKGKLRDSFVDFINNELITPDKYTVVTTEREGLDLNFKSNTAKYYIERLELIQQETLLRNLCTIYKVSKPVSNKYEKELTADKLIDKSISSNPFNLTNAFFYLLEHRELPSNQDQLASELIKLFFIRKGEEYDDNMNRALTMIAMEMKASSRDELSELDIKKCIKGIFKGDTQVDFLEKCYQKVGFLNRRYNTGEKLDYYKFESKKYMENLVNLFEAKSITSVTGLKEYCQEKAAFRTIKNVVANKEWIVFSKDVRDDFLNKLKNSTL